MNRLLAIAIATALGLAATAAWGAGDPELGKGKSFTCNVCHGTDGKSEIPRLQGGVAKLAGMDQQKFLEAVKAYRYGKSFHPLMQLFVLPMSDKDVEDLAAYYSSKH